jgi:hypothetical protein
MYAALRSGLGPRLQKGRKLWYSEGVLMCGSAFVESTFLVLAAFRTI